MNIPNVLTLFRVVMIPFFVLAFLGDSISNWIAFFIFIIAAITDALDGYIARKQNIVTDFGKLMDPLADKLLVSAALICLTAMDRLAAWIVIVIISREFIISGLRQIASDNGIVIAASYWGKYKTTFQIIMICLLIVNMSALAVVTMIVTWVAVALTIISMVDYMYKNRKVFLEDK